MSSLSEVFDAFDSRWTTSDQRAIRNIIENTGCTQFDIHWNPDPPRQATYVIAGGDTARAILRANVGYIEIRDEFADYAMREGLVADTTPPQDGGREKQTPGYTLMRLANSAASRGRANQAPADIPASICEKCGDFAPAATHVCE